MTLLEEITAERIALRQDILDLARQIRDDARHAVESTHNSRVLIAAIVGHETEFYPLSWSNDYEKHAILQSLNAHLAERNVSGAVMTWPVYYKDKRDPDSVEIPAVAIMMRAPDWKRLHVYPFTINTQDQIIWHDVVMETDFDTTLLNVPAPNGHN